MIGPEAATLSSTQASDEAMPKTIAVVIPCRVVPFQNSSITRAGRFAEAAMLNAQPTRNVTLKFLNRMPSTIASTPTTTAAILPQRTFS